MIPERRSRPASVYIAEDHPVYRKALVRIVTGHERFEVVGFSGDGREALQEIRKLAPSIAMLDLDMPGMTGTRILEGIRGTANLRTRVLFLSGSADAEIIHDSLSGGAMGYITKQSSEENIHAALNKVMRNEVILPGDLVTDLAAQIRKRYEEHCVLTNRELSILRLTSQGKTTVEIASTLHLSQATVKTHLRHVYDKFEVNTAAAAVAIAMRRGLLD